MAEDEEILYYAQELDSIIIDINNKMKGVAKSKGEKRAQQVTDTQDRINRAKQVLHSFKIELRELNEPILRGEYEAKGKEYSTTLQTLISDLQWQKSEGDREDLLSGHSNEMNVDNMGASELIDEGKKVQEQSSKSVKNSKKMIEQSKKVGQETAVKLKQQTEQLTNIDNDIQKVESNLMRGDVQLRLIGKKLMTDKIVMVFMCLIFIGIIAIICIHLMYPDDSEFNVPDRILPNVDGSSSRSESESESKSEDNADDGFTNVGRKLLVRAFTN